MLVKVWIEVVGSPGSGTVADGRDLAAGERVEVEPGTARRLLAMGSARLIEPPGEDQPVAMARKRTR